MRIALRSISLAALCGLLGACSHLGPTRLAGDPEPPAAEEGLAKEGFFAKLLSPRKADDGDPKDATKPPDESEPAPAGPTEKGFFAKLLSPRKADDGDPKDATTAADEDEPAPAEPAKKGFFAKLFPWSQKTPEPEESQPEPEPAPAAVDDEAPLPSAMDSSEPAPREPETTLAPAQAPSPASGKPGDPLDDVGLYPKDQ